MAAASASATPSPGVSMKTDSRIVAVKKHHKRGFQLIHAALDFDGQGKQNQALLNYRNGLKEIVAGCSIDCDGPDCVGKEWDKVKTLQQKMSANREQIDTRVLELESKSTSRMQAGNDSPNAQALIDEAQRQVQNSRILGNRKAHGPISQRALTTSQASASRDQVSARTASGQTGKANATLLKNVDPKIRDAILNEVMQDCAKVKLESIIGLDGAKRALSEIVVLPALRPELFTGLRAPARGLLLFGPPGNGKTMLAKAIANEAKSTFFNISASSLTSKYMGESEKLVRALFLCARALEPAIIFIDEVDSVLTKRSDNEHEASRRLKTEILVCFDGVGSSADDRVLVMGATNLPHELDEAALRRFTKRIYIPMPGPKARQSLITSLLKDTKADLSSRDMSYIVEQTGGYSSSDLNGLTRDAALGPIRELGSRIVDVPADRVRPITKKDFVGALVNIRPSTSKDTIKVFEEWNRDHGTAA